MILVDTSVWVDFFNQHSKAAQLGSLLKTKKVKSHPWIIGELSLGNYGGSRPQVFFDLSNIKYLPVLDPFELIHFVDQYRLYGQGLSFIDVHLLCSSKLENIPIWTHDKALKKAAKKFECEYVPE